MFMNLNRKNSGLSILDRRIGIRTLVILALVGIWMVKFGWPILANWTFQDAVVAFFASFYSIMTIQAGLFLYWTLYAWNDPAEVGRNKSPKIFVAPKLSFTALLPVRHEEKVIRDTIKAIDKIHYPEELKELLILVRGDDRETISAAQKTIDDLGRENIKMVIVNDQP